MRRGTADRLVKSLHLARPVLYGMMLFDMVVRTIAQVVRKIARFSLSAKRRRSAGSLGR